MDENMQVISSEVNTATSRGTSIETGDYDILTAMKVNAMDLNLTHSNNTEITSSNTPFIFVYGLGIPLALLLLLACCYAFYHGLKLCQKFNNRRASELNNPSANPDERDDRWVFYSYPDLENPSEVDGNDVNSRDDTAENMSAANNQSSSPERDNLGFIPETNLIKSLEHTEMRFISNRNDPLNSAGNDLPNVNIFISSDSSMNYSSNTECTDKLRTCEKPIGLKITPDTMRINLDSQDTSKYIIKRTHSCVSTANNFANTDCLLAQETENQTSSSNVKVSNLSLENPHPKSALKVTNVNSTIKIDNSELLKAIRSQSFRENVDYLNSPNTMSGKSLTSSKHFCSNILVKNKNEKSLKNDDAKIFQKDVILNLKSNAAIKNKHSETKPPRIPPKRCPPVVPPKPKLPPKGLMASRLPPKITVSRITLDTVVPRPTLDTLPSSRKEKTHCLPITLDTVVPRQSIEPGVLEITHDVITQRINRPFARSSSNAGAISSSKNIHVESRNSYTVNQIRNKDCIVLKSDTEFSNTTAHRGKPNLPIQVTHSDSQLCHRCSLIGNYALKRHSL